ncbi:MAG: Cytochrome, partial [Pseudomonadota bacterium]
MKLVHCLGVMAAVAVISTAAISQNAVTVAKSAAEAQKAIEARQQVFKDMKKANDVMSAMLKNQREFDAALVATSAAQIQELVGKIPAAFLVDTRQFPDIKTVARENIWSSQADFKAKSEDTAKAAANVVAVAKGG